jgi:hypothetical protein
MVRHSGRSSWKGFDRLGANARSDCRGSGRLAKPYPAPTASQVPALAVNTTVAMKITVSIRDNFHAVGIGDGLRPDSWGCGQPV